jgi:hypothetical protein
MSKPPSHNIVRCNGIEISLSIAGLICSYFVIHVFKKGIFKGKYLLGFLVGIVYDFLYVYKGKIFLSKVKKGREIFEMTNSLS